MRLLSIPRDRRFIIIKHRHRFKLHDRSILWQLAVKELARQVGS